MTFTSKRRTYVVPRQRVAPLEAKSFCDVTGSAPHVPPDGPEPWGNVRAQIDFDDSEESEQSSDYSSQFDRIW